MPYFQERRLTMNGVFNPLSVGLFIVGMVVVGGLVLRYWGLVRMCFANTVGNPTVLSPAVPGTKLIKVSQVVNVTAPSSIEHAVCNVYENGTDPATCGPDDPNHKNMYLQSATSTVYAQFQDPYTSANQIALVWVFWCPDKSSCPNPQELPYTEKVFQPPP
jgi:hypothetical protein